VARNAQSLAVKSLADSSPQDSVPSHAKTGHRVAPARAEMTSGGRQRPELIDRRAGDPGNPEPGTHPQIAVRRFSQRLRDHFSCRVRQQGYDYEVAAIVSYDPLGRTDHQETIPGLQDIIYDTRGTIDGDSGAEIAGRALSRIERDCGATQYRQSHKAENRRTREPEIQSHTQGVRGFGASRSALSYIRETAVANPSNEGPRFPSSSVSPKATPRYAQTVLRLFSIFPSRGPGVALLLLRVAVALTILSDASEGLAALAPQLVFGGLALLALALCLGFATPLAALLGCVFQLAGLFLVDRSDLHLALSIVNSAALVLLGPGAYSIDARLFGRQVTVLPTADTDRKPRRGRR
jgi:hypothetical protein